MTKSFLSILIMIQMLIPTEFGENLELDHPKKLPLDVFLDINKNTVSFEIEYLGDMKMISKRKQRKIPTI